MSRKIRHVWTKTNQYIKIHRQNGQRLAPRKHTQHYDVALGKEVIFTVFIIVVVLGLLFG
jgi:hypothetical protein